MSRRAAKKGFERFVDLTVEETRREFSVGRALSGTVLGPGGRGLDLLRRRADVLEANLLEPHVELYRERSVAQFDVLLDCVEAGREEGVCVEGYREELMAHDSFVEALDPSVGSRRREALYDDVLSRLERLGEGVEPLVESPEDEFWPAVESAYGRREAVGLVEDVMPFTGPLRRHSDALRFEVRLDPGEILGGVVGRALPAARLDYGSEAVRSMCRAEAVVVDEMKRQVESRFDE